MRPFQWDGHDVITISGISATGFHGVFDHERREGQTFVVDVKVATSFRVSAASDDVSDTLDYGLMSQAVVEEIQGGPYNLIEKLASVIVDRLMRDFAPLAVQVTVHKPEAPIPVPFGDVAVTMSRSRS
ncbi:dihydroneopterin aldolase [Pseudoglutamicibacter albus]|uniref:7,8-dihydroneopterin aldolase n=1 Tax=Pseudoglutamicibacter cumminsii TaxID=156979 RepID=A0ABX5L6E7_9MICC|nr:MULTISPECIES: dihydroneopterin aldolase [Pseudoglutamicibacter]MCT1685381.1 dihydroneopterin aldolase [Pseudoglutamicibacter cumminsii]MDK7083958.1 dihydroneopterin aldolase [Pseudoglutamicibacter cumminsii]MDZ3744712.1 dihydroneopterin aldolase [Pseudoglutamicibacter cumminsii]PKY79774.1 dihydroneopterin aldolase [Pseudoglutamicibacter albus]PWI27924.1 dihydroneopterin aldolase [Pseudoglutamicibacter cumminsii]